MEPKGQLTGALVDFEKQRLAYWLGRILNTKAADLASIDSHTLRLMAQNAIGYHEQIRTQFNLFCNELDRRSRSALASDDDRYPTPKVLLPVFTRDTLPVGKGFRPQPQTDRAGKSGAPTPKTPAK